ncbi:MAG TPA: hypothetical protein VF251_15375, partial [Pyrinomonadaceae bacterium]
YFLFQGFGIIATKRRFHAKALSERRDRKEDFSLCGLVFVLAPLRETLLTFAGLALNALSREVFVVNIFCEQPKLSIEEPNATRKIHATDLCLRLYAVANVRIYKLPT